MILTVATFADLDPQTLYALLRLRADVFVVEQRSPYPDLDGRDTEPGTRHLWLAADGEGQGQGQGKGEGDADGGEGEGPRAYLRIVREPDGTARVGRVCTAVKARGAGLSGRLVTAALELIGERAPCALDAQSHLVGFYQRYGFVASGPEFVEDGIAHTPMRRPAGLTHPRPTDLAQDPGLA